jgi:MraZ protein
LLNIDGTYECKVDAKGRLMFPVAFKNQLSDLIGQGFMIKRSIFGNCLELYPIQEWRKEKEKTNKISRFKEQNVKFLRKFTAGSQKIELDSVGRLLIPKDLAVKAGISKDVVLASVVNKIEIWDKDQYEKAIDIDPEEFAKLAEEVMGDKDTE